MNKKFEYSRFCIPKQGYSNWDIGSGGYDSGTVVLPQNTCDMYMQGDEKHVHHTSLRVPSNGYMYVRNFDRRYSRQYAVTLAKKFIKDIQAQKSE